MGLGGGKTRRQLEKLKFGPRRYTPAQAKTIRRAVAERKPLKVDPLDKDDRG